MQLSLDIFSNCILNDGPFSFRYTFNTKKSWLVHPPFKCLIEYFKLLSLFNIRFIFSIKINTLTYTSYKEHFERNIEIYRSNTFTDYQNELLMKNRMMVSDEVIILFTLRIGSRNKSNYDHQFWRCYIYRWF